MSLESIITEIKANFKSSDAVQEKRTGIYQLYLPIYHEDGDGIDLFLTEKNGEAVLCDFGLTLQRLAYTIDIDTENKRSILNKIVSENELLESDGNIYLPVHNGKVFNDIMQITQAYAKIGSMRFLKREIIESLFFEMLDEFVMTDLAAYRPTKDVTPIPSREDIKVDYQFSPNGHPVYLFGVKDTTKARLTTISYLEFQKAKLNYRGWVVNEDFEKLPKKDRAMLINNSDKQFTSFDEFKEKASAFLERERSL